MLRLTTLAVLIASVAPSLSHAAGARWLPDSGNRALRASVSAKVVGLAVQEPAAVELETLIDDLASLDFSTRTRAARLVRRAPAPDAVAALTAAVRSHADEFVRYRALVLLTAFNDRGTRDLMVGLLRDRNDRLREVAYKWLERNPDPRLTVTLLAALQTEQAEFVRPALVGALAALDENAEVRRALLAESMRGLDFFREAVIEALGRQRAEYAVDTIAGITTLDGPLRQSAILALGRIGGPRARAALEEMAAEGGTTPAVRAAQCLAGMACAAHLEALGNAIGVTGAGPDARASIDALSVVATGSDGISTDAIAALIALAARDGVVREQAALGFSAVALRRPEAIVAWLDTAPEDVRTAAIDLLQEGFERLEEDFAEEQFYAAARAAYWTAAEGSATRALSAAIIQGLEF